MVRRSVSAISVLGKLRRERDRKNAAIAFSSLPPSLPSLHPHLLAHHDSVALWCEASEDLEGISLLERDGRVEAVAGRKEGGREGGREGREGG